MLTSNSFVYEQAEKEGLVKIINDFGARFSIDICLCSLSEQMFPMTTKTVMTNTGKFDIGQVLLIKV